MKTLVRARNALKSLSHHLYRTLRKEVNFRRFRPTHALFFMTYRCTCRCQSCTMWKKDAMVEQEMTLEDWIACFDDINAVGLQDVELFGGDALLRADVLMPLIRHIHDRGVHTNITVNGSLLDRNNAQALVQSGLDEFNISIDAMGALHDRMRGIEGLFEKARQGIAYVLEARGNGKKPEVALNATISAVNVQDVEALVDFAKEQGMDTVNFEPFGAISQESIEGSAVGGKKPDPYFVPTTGELLFSRDQALELKRRLAELKKRVRGQGIYVTSENIDILTADQLAACAFPNIPCYICRYLVTIDPYGNVLPCPYFDNYTLGNIRTERFGSIWRNAKHLEFVRQQRQERIAMCNHCSIGVQRNRTLTRALLGLYLTARKKAR